MRQGAGHFRLLCTGDIHVRCRCRINSAKCGSEPRLSVESNQELKIEWDLHGLEKVCAQCPNGSLEPCQLVESHQALAADSETPVNGLERLHRCC